MRLRMLIGCLLLVACTPSNKEIKRIVEQTETSYANHLRILKKGDAYLVTIENAENNSIFRYWLSRNKPKKLDEGVVFIQVPIKNLVALSSTHIGMLEKIGELRVVAGVGNADYIYSKHIRSSIQTKKVIAYGDDTQLSPERLIRNHPDLIIYSGFDVSFPNASRLEKYGIICMPNFDWKESHPLGKAEWIKLFGCLTGKYEASKKYFEGVSKKYNNLAKQSKETVKKNRLLSGNRIGDLWYCPAGESYFAKLYQDAGFNYPYASTKGVGSLSLSFERIVTENQNADIWVNPGSDNLQLITSGDSRYQLFKPVKSGQVFCYSHAMNRFWELSAIEPDRVLEDLLHIAKGQTKEDLYFYKRVL